MRVELRDGQWADLRDHITHGKDKEIRRTRREFRERSQDDPDVQLEWTTTFTRYFIRDWLVRDPETSAPIPVTDADALDRAPEDIVDLLFTRAAELWIAATVPNSPTPPSSADSSSDKGSETPRSTDSQTPTPSEMPSSS